MSMHSKSADTTGTGSAGPPKLWPGCLLWAGFSLLALLLRGVRWDEDFEFAQAMVDLVPYPAGHPLLQYTRGAYNLQFYLSAAIVKVFPDPVVLCSMRNYLFILSTTLPVFLLTALLCRRVLYGHAAAVLVLFGIHFEFDGSYPQFVWPGMFSNGHIGMAFALIVVACLASGAHRTGFLLLGLMPAIHLGQAPALMLYSAAYVAWCWYEDKAALRRGLPWLGLGLVICMLFLFAQRSFVLPPPVEGPYVSDADPRPIWEGRIRYHDLHRSIPVGNSHLITAGILLLLVGRVLRSRCTGVERCGWHIEIFALCVVAVVYGTILAHLIMGPGIPYAFLTWLPYRLANHLPLLLLALILAELARRDRPSGDGLVAAVLVFILLRTQLVLWGVVSQPAFDRFLHATDSVYFALFGAASAFLALDTFRSRVVAMTLLAVICLSLSVYHQFGAACVGAGATIGPVLSELSRGREAASAGRSFSVGRILGGTVSGLLSIAIGYVLVEEFEHGEHLPVGALERSAAAYLAATGHGDAMLVGPPYQLLLQAQTGHPVMVDMATGFYFGYVPSLAPSVQKVYREIYGVDFTEPADGPGAPQNWRAVWETRTAADWRAVGTAYGVEYVIGPSEMEIELEPVIRGPHDTLWRIQAGYGIVTEDRSTSMPSHLH